MRQRGGIVKGAGGGFAMNNPPYCEAMGRGTARRVVEGQWRNANGPSVTRFARATSPSLCDREDLTSSAYPDRLHCHI